MNGNINHQMSHGIDCSKAIVIFITKRYLLKVDGGGPLGDDDNCKFEFEYALNRKGVASMVPVIMEPGCKATSSWQGVVGGKLGSRLYCDATEDGEKLDDAVSQIVDALAISGVRPSASRKGQPADADVNMLGSDAA